jgi:hypothetical protein
MRATQTAPDWAVMIEQMVAAGLTFSDIAKATQSVLTDRMVKHYAAGVQPLYWRGEAMIVLWCKSLRADRAALPTCEIVRGHRVTQNKQVSTAPVLRNLPQWPAAMPAPAKVVKVQRGDVVSVEGERYQVSMIKHRRKMSEA